LHAPVPHCSKNHLNDLVNGAVKMQDLKKIEISSFKYYPATRGIDKEDAQNERPVINPLNQQTYHTRIDGRPTWFQGS
jgi:hypothetical protein